MLPLTDKIKTRLNKCTALQLQSWLLGLICFSFMFLVRYRTAWHWDDVACLKNLIRGLPSDLLLGRPGFMYPFIWLWFALREVFGASFSVVEDSIRIGNIFFLTGTFVLLYRILLLMSVSVRVAFLTIVFILSEFSFSVISSRAADSALMYLCILASYYFFILAFQQQKKNYLFAAAGLFGYAFLVREPALLFLPGFVVLAFRFKAQAKFKAKNYLTAIGIFTGICVIVPLLMALYYGQFYLDTLKNSFSYGYIFSYSDMPAKALAIWKTHINLITVPVSIAGLVIFFKRYGWKNFAEFFIFFLAPVFLAFLYSSEAILKEPRLYLGLFSMIALGLAVLVDAVCASINKSSVRNSVLTIGSAVLIVATALRFVPQYKADLNEISRLEKYYESIKPLLGPKVVLIIGNETLYVAYRGLVDKNAPHFASPGWGWPKGQLVEIIKNTLNDNMTVIYDARTRSFNEAKRAKDLDEMAATFDLTETKNGFTQVTLKK